MEAAMDNRTYALWKAAECVFYGTGIIGFLVVYGFIQEKIMTIGYAGELFRASVFLVFCNRFVAVIYALVMMLMVKKESALPQAPIWKYCVVSVSNVAASTCQYEALKYVSFPVQMLGKSFKMMPVMCWGIVISGKRYSLRDWSVAACVTGGVVLFLMTGSIASKHHTHSSVWGLVLLLAFLAADGLTSTMQESVFREHKTSKYNQMFYINGASALISLITLLATGNLIKSLAFCAHHPGFIGDAVGLSIAAVAGQFFIYSQVKEFGALVFAATMNVRQIVSILVSYIRYGHAITLWQVVALGVVFAALFYKSAAGFLSVKEGEEKEREPIVAKKNENEDKAQP